MSILGTGIVKACKKRSNKMSMFFIFPAFNNENWPLKPLFFEVPSISSTTFVGRKWLFREVLEHLSSDLPTSGGMIIQGMQASGKSSIILRLVQGSCFGHQGKHSVLSPLETSKSDFRRVQYDIVFLVTIYSGHESIRCPETP